MAKVLLSLGSNQGDRINYLAAAIYYIHKLVGKVLITAPIYETAAWGKTDQHAFLNTCVLIETKFPPVFLFRQLKLIEQILKRSGKERWGPREIDIDILLFEDLIISNQTVQIPHIAMQDRKFVLQPAAAICANWRHPFLQKTMRQLLNICPDTLEVKPWKG